MTPNMMNSLTLQIKVDPKGTVAQVVRHLEVRTLARETPHRWGVFVRVNLPALAPTNDLTIPTEAKGGMWLEEHRSIESYLLAPEDSVEFRYATFLPLSFSSFYYYSQLLLLYKQTNNNSDF